MNAACQRFQSLIARLAEGDVDESTRAAIRAHARQCPDCAATYAFQLRLRGALTQAALETPPPVYFEGVLAEIHRQMPAAAPRPRTRRREWRVSRRALGNSLLALFLMTWLGVLWASSDHAPRPLPQPGVAGAADEAMIAQAERPRPPRSAPTATLFYREEYGLVPAGSPLRTMSPDELRQIGWLAQNPEPAPGLKRG